jgi:hypothetical protein
MLYILRIRLQLFTLVAVRKLVVKLAIVIQVSNMRIVLSPNQDLRTSGYYCYVHPSIALGLSNFSCRIEVRYDRSVFLHDKNSFHHRLHIIH